MRTDKKEAINLRRRGKSYNEIREILRVPKSTLSDWLRNSNWSIRIKNELTEKNHREGGIHLRKLNKIYRTNLSKIYDEAKNEAKEEFEHFKFHPLFVAGIMLYWGEGDKSSKYNVRIANTDPLMIKLFIRFLSDICGITKNKIRAYLLLYPDLNPEDCKHFWFSKTGLSEKNFNKCIIIKGRHKIRRLKYGVCTSGITSRYLKEKILIWLDLLPKKLLQ